MAINKAIVAQISISLLMDLPSIQKNKINGATKQKYDALPFVNENVPEGRK
ncbi:hypothetical protein GCM10023188_35940 [Pontibacter saemangeumensis]|uniref:Uncharacterized protein n=1 Tax=Pontibacter saemangeumensis TaxID=1084525 RepID=A0ABP8M0I6_9BACT